jgi:hypothetical protein
MASIWAKITQAVIGDGLGNNIVNYLTKKREIAAQAEKQKLEFDLALHERKIKLIEQGLHADMAWETEFAKQAASSWKDEYTLLVVSVPLVLAFIPGLSVYVDLGFKSFSSTPIWYQVMVQTLFYATVGVRLWRREQSDT